jgi:hypothetical protein
MQQIGSCVKRRIHFCSIRNHDSRHHTFAVDALSTTDRGTIGSLTNWSLKNPKMRLNFENIREFLQKKEASRLSIPLINQVSDNTCWAACYQMIDSHRHGKQQNICKYVHLQTNTCVQCFRPQHSCDKPRPINNILTDWKTLGYKKTIHEANSLTRNRLHAALRDYNPIMAFIKFRNDPIGHYFLMRIRC